MLKSLLAKGYFLRELPPSFNSVSFASHTLRSFPQTSPIRLAGLEPCGYVVGYKRMLRRRIDARRAEISLERISKIANVDLLSDNHCIKDLICSHLIPVSVECCLRTSMVRRRPTVLRTPISKSISWRVIRRPTTFLAGSRISEAVSCGGAINHGVCPSRTLERIAQ